MYCAILAAPNGTQIADSRFLLVTIDSYGEGLPLGLVYFLLGSLALSLALSYTVKTLYLKDDGYIRRAKRRESMSVKKSLLYF